MTVSFHKYGDNFFPGTGCLSDVGEKNGRYYSVNVPLKDGVDDNTFKQLFQPIMSKVMEVFKPGAIVMQCGGFHMKLCLFHQITRLPQFCI